MAIVSVSRLNGGSSPEVISAEESDSNPNSPESDVELDLSDLDSGAESDEFDLDELGESGFELCQVKNQTFSIPIEIYDLPNLTSVFSLEIWNGCLTEEERFYLSEFLPDMDRETLGLTLIELFGGRSFHFDCPMNDFFEKLRGGMLDPRIVLYRKGVNILKRREYYHLLREYQDSMVGGFVRIRDAWERCEGYEVEERSRILSILRSRKCLVWNGSVGSDTGSDSLGEDFRASERFPKVLARKERLVVNGFEKKSTASNGILSFPRHNHAVRFDLESSQRAKNQMSGGGGDDDDDDDEEEEDDDDILEEDCGAGNKKSHVGLPQYNSKIRIANQGATVAAYNPHLLETMSNAKYPAKDWKYPVKDHVQHQGQKGIKGKMHEQVISSDRQVKTDFSVKSKKWKADDDPKRGKNRTGLDPTAMPYKTSSAQMTQGKFKGKSAYNGGLGMEYSRGGTIFSQSDETESDSLLEVEDGEISPYMNTEGPQPEAIQPVYNSKKSSKITQVNIKAEPYSTKGKYKSNTADYNYTEDIILVKKTQMPHSVGKLPKPSQKSYTTDKKRKGEVGLNHLSDSNYKLDYGGSRLDETAGYLDGSAQYADIQVQDNKSDNRYQAAEAFTSETGRYGRSDMSLLGCNSATKKRKGNSKITKKDETGESGDPQSIPVQQNGEPNFIKKKAKRKADAAVVPSVVTPDVVIPEKEIAYVEPESKPQKKPFTLITPTTHTGFSFSIIHIFSAIRKAMITSHIEEPPAMDNHLDKGDFKLKSESEENKELQAMDSTLVHNSDLNMNVNISESVGQNNLPSLTIEEIVNRVRTNPGDPCILETQEPLQDLVRGVLKIFSSKTAPLGAKSWKALALYERPKKSWFWVGPVSSTPLDNDIFEETSSEAWGLPHKTLVKLVDSFANWLKNGQETLKQIGTLPPPPTSLLQHLDEKERFRDLRAQKSLNTINPSSEEVRKYFRKEEILRYAIPDRAFSYTATDGKKSIVAPLRRGGAKSTSKARDHFMLKPDRPPHVTILCLVRDAAARLPGSIGTRADVCTLIRDSQYIAEDVTDEKINQVVSGALDRLHYERDPCVQFDGERKLWVYLHRGREEEDFEDDGTSSTKKWKRPRKDATDQPDTEAGTESSYPTTGDQAGGGSGGYDLNSDLNINTLLIQEGTENISIYGDLRSNTEKMQMQLYIDQSLGEGVQGNSMSWVPPGLNPPCENKILCQENSTEEQFDNEAFGRERPVGVLSASLL